MCLLILLCMACGGGSKGGDSPAQPPKPPVTLPVLVSAVPASGAVGDLVTLRGTNLGGTTRAAFGPANTMPSKVSDTEIEVTVLMRGMPRLGLTHPNQGV